MPGTRSVAGGWVGGRSTVPPPRPVYPSWWPRPAKFRPKQNNWPLVAADRSPNQMKPNLSQLTSGNCHPLSTQLSPPPEFFHPALVLSTCRSEIARGVCSRIPHHHISEEKIRQRRRRRKNLTEKSGAGAAHGRCGKCCGWNYGRSQPPDRCNQSSLRAW